MGKKLKIKQVLFTLLALFLGFFSFYLISENVENKSIYVSKTNNIANIITPFSILSKENVKNEEKKLEYFYFNKESKEYEKKLKISAEAYIVGDLDIGEIILAKNQDKKFPIASISKLMTASVAKELSSEKDITKVTKKALDTYGENGNLKIGEKIKIRDLIYPLLLESSNDAAEVLAQHFNRNIFLNKMNKMAENLQMSNTYFSDPSGLSIKNQSTVSDMFKLTGYLKLNNKELLDITTKKSFSIKGHTWFSNNQFLHEDGYMGGKSGYTDPAKQTVVSTFSLKLGENDTRPIAIVLLQSKDRQKDVLNIVNYLKKNVYYGGKKDATSPWIQERLKMPDIKEPDFVTLAFLGDIMLDRGVRNSVNKNFKGDYSALFEKLSILKKSDIVFANLEGTASDKGKDLGNLYSFRMDPSVIPSLKGAGINMLSVANNHVGDWGRIAYIDTLSRLKENEIQYTGGGSLFEAENPTIVEKNGIKIGYLGFSDVGPSWMEATEDSAGLLLANNPKFDIIIQNASKQVDYLIVSFHFGDEYKTKHNKRQEYLAHKAIDNGAKIVVGHHPHVIEDVEIYSPKSCTQNSCVGYIAYSLGNFIFDQKFSTNTMQGMFLEIKLNKNGSMSARKNTIKLNSFFQPDKIIFGKEEIIKFQTPKTSTP